MKPKILSYDETCINKNAFHKTTTSINIDEADINKITLCDKTSYGNKGSIKYHIGYRYKNEVLLSPLNIKLPQRTQYTKHFDNNNKFVKKNTVKYGIRLKAYAKQNLIKSHCTAINILVLI